MTISASAVSKFIDNKRSEALTKLSDAFKEKTENTIRGYMSDESSDLGKTCREFADLYKKINDAENAVLLHFENQMRSTYGDFIFSRYFYKESIESMTTEDLAYTICESYYKCSEAFRKEESLMREIRKAIVNQYEAVVSNVKAVRNVNKKIDYLKELGFNVEVLMNEDTSNKFLVKPVDTRYLMLN